MHVSVSQPMHSAYVAGSDRPELDTVRVGFMPLTDCASIVMASRLGFDRKHGVRLVPLRQQSWAAVRDKLASGELHLAQALYGLVYGVHLGIGSPRIPMAALMTLNRNGQGITLSRALAERGAVDGDSLARLMRGETREFTFAQTFPTGTHAMWLYYWLAAHGMHPTRDVKVITVPPPQMVGQMHVGRMDGFSVGEPWNHRAVIDGIGITATTSQQIWPDHPEKVLGATAEFVERHPNTARAVVAAVLEASRWIDESDDHRARMARAIAAPDVIDTSVAAIEPRILGHYDDGCGRQWQDPHRMTFFDGGAVNFPYLSDGMWFLTQYKRWGLLAEHPDYVSVTSAVNRIALYREAALQAGVDIPAAELRTSRLVDGVVWNASDPAAYADGFALRTTPPVACLSSHGPAHDAAPASGLSASPQGALS
jgi:nitrate/nitrite transport system substrate-binding protein